MSERLRLRACVASPSHTESSAPWSGSCGGRRYKRNLARLRWRGFSFLGSCATATERGSSPPPLSPPSSVPDRTSARGARRIVACSEAARTPVLHQRCAARLPLLISVAVPNLCFHDNIYRTFVLLAPFRAPHTISLVGMFQLKTRCSRAGSPSR